MQVQRLVEGVVRADQMEEEISEEEEEMSRKFDHFPEEKICPVCDTNEDRPCILVPIPGTEEGNIMQAKPFHYDCAYSIASIVVHILEWERTQPIEGDSDEAITGVRTDSTTDSNESNPETGKR